MNINSLIQGFNSYLEELNRVTNSQYATGADNVSIFLYSNEFKNYIAQQTGADSSIASMSINDILNMEIKNGQLVDKSDNSYQAGEDGKEGENEQASVVDIFNEFLKDDSVKKAIDTDGNNEISDEEIQAFMTIANQYDKDATNLSLEDLLSAAQDIQKGTFGTQEITPEIPEGEGAGDTGSADGASGSSGSSGSSGTGGNSGDYNSGNDDGVKEKTLDNMTEQELNTELSGAESTLTDKQNSLDAILNGTDSSIQELQKAVDDSYNKYQEQLKSLDSDLAAKLDEKVQAITAKEQEISQNDIAISKQENTVSSCETSYNNASSRLDNLNSIKQGLQNTNTTNMTAEQKAEVDNKLRAIEAQISEAEAAKTKAKEDWDNAKTELERINATKTQLTSELQTLNDEKAQIDADVMKLETSNPELKTVRETYENAKKSLTEGKETAAAKAKSEVKEAQDYVNKVQEAVQTKKNKEDIVQYSPNQMTNLVRQALELAESQIGVKERTGNNDGEPTKYGAGDGVAWCAAFVSWCYGKGQNGVNNNPLKFTATVSNLRDQAKKAGYYSEANNYTPVPGDIMIQKNGGASHTGIVYACDGEYIYTIEGNSGNQVRKRKYKLGDYSRISGYIRMNEWSGGTANLPGNAYTNTMIGETKSRSTY